MCKGCVQILIYVINDFEFRKTQKLSGKTDIFSFKNEVKLKRFCLSQDVI